MESVNKRVIIISLVLAIFTTSLVYLYIQKATAKTEVTEYINVYVAATTLPAKHLITEADIKKSRVTREYLSPQAVLNEADIIGKRLKDRVIEGEQILRDRLVDDKDLTLAFNLPVGKRAMAVNVSEQIAVGYLIKPGDTVDVIANFSGANNEPNMTKIVIQNVTVLAVGKNMGSAEEKSQELPNTVTLAVTPQDAEKLSFVSEFESIRLILRNIEDEKTVNTDGVIKKDMTGIKGAQNVLPVQEP
ncbi:MAG: Flp pilus assembly protein CpaB [Clostridium sp.]|jgi:pilus assembly protein CpaB|nr:Flp pilus assembly protein CpaB [Clostridium sp.]